MRGRAYSQSSWTSLSHGVPRWIEIVIPTKSCDPHRINVNGECCMTKPVVRRDRATRHGRSLPTQVHRGTKQSAGVPEVAGALPLMFSGTPDITDIDALRVCRRDLLTGARANIHPACSASSPIRGTNPTTTARRHCACADRGCVARSVPLFGICREIQEMNGAFGGSLHPEIPRPAGTHEPPHAPAGQRRVHPIHKSCSPTSHEVRWWRTAYSRSLGRDSDPR